jgi:hypothetical protein
MPSETNSFWVRVVLGLDFVLSFLVVFGLVAYALFNV